MMRFGSIDEIIFTADVADDDQNNKNKDNNSRNGKVGEGRTESDTITNLKHKQMKIKR